MRLRMPSGTSTADVSDEYGTGAACCSTQFLSYGGRSRFEGVVVTLRGYEDNTPLKDLVREPGRGRVIVIDGGASLRCALLGDKNAQFAADNGWVGFVVNGTVRDVAHLASIDIGILALGTSPRKSLKDGNCVLGEPAHFGDTIFTPGDYVVADEDGVVVVPSRNDPHL